MRHNRKMHLQPFDLKDGMIGGVAGSRGLRSGFSSPAVAS
jgi:hypothetical protein